MNFFKIFFKKVNQELTYADSKRSIPIIKIKVSKKDIIFVDFLVNAGFCFVIKKKINKYNIIFWFKPGVFSRAFYMRWSKAKFFENPKNIKKSVFIKYYRQGFNGIFFSVNGFMTIHDSFFKKENFPCKVYVLV